MTREYEDDPLLRELRAGIAEHLVRVPPPDVDTARIVRAHRTRRATVAVGAATALAVGAAALVVAVRDPGTVQPVGVASRPPVATASAPAPTPPLPATTAGAPTATPTVNTTVTPTVVAPPATVTVTVAPPGPGTAPSGTAACTPVAAASPELRRLLVAEVRVAGEPAIARLNARLTALGLPAWQPTDDEVAALVDVDAMAAGIAGLPASDCGGRLQVEGIDEDEVRDGIAREVELAVDGILAGLPAPSP